MIKKVIKFLYDVLGMPYYAVIKAIKAATNTSSLPWSSHTSKNDRAASYSDKGLCKQYELKQHGRLAKLLHEQSTACSVVEAQNKQ